MQIVTEIFNDAFWYIVPILVVLSTALTYVINQLFKVSDRIGIKVKVVNKSSNQLPVYSDPNDAGMDLRANIEDDLTILPLERKLIPTGLFIQLPEGYEAQVRPRSGLALKHGISVCNSPGTVDAGYRSEIGVILINFGNEAFIVHPGDRIAQIVFKKYEKAELIEVESLDMENDRGGGYGHSGVK